MGQKVKGYRRNVKYGTNIRRQPTKTISTGTFKVNPTGRYGWDMGTTGRKEGEYGEIWNRGNKRLNHVEEMRVKGGCVTNGLGRRGNGQKGYMVYGEYCKRGEKEVSVDLKKGRERVVIRYETKRKVKVGRKRVDLDERRFSKEIKEEKWIRKDIRTGRKGPKSNMKEAMCRVVAMGGKRNREKIRAKRVAIEREGGRNHMERRRGIDSRRRIGARNERGKGYYGYKVTVKGRFDGARRTMKYEMKKGKVPRTTTRARIGIGEEVAKTSVGTIGVRVEYCYGRG